MADSLVGRRKKPAVGEAAVGRRARLRKQAIAEQRTPETTGSLIYGFGAPESGGVGGLAAKGLARRTAASGLGRAVASALGPAAPALFAPPASVAAKRKRVGKYVKRRG